MSHNALFELYHALIIEHSKHPRCFGPLASCTHTAHGHNPLCGDEVSIYLELGQDAMVNALQFEGKGCAISTASASLMAMRLRGLPLEKALEVTAHFESMVKSGLEVDLSSPPFEQLGSLRALAGVRQFPARIKCATLAWHAFKAALKGEGLPVTTDDGLR